MRFTVPANDAGSLDEMLRTLKPVRLDRYDAIADRSFSNREFGVGSSVLVPIIVNGRLWGSLGTLNEGRRLPMETEERLAKFAELVSSALANVHTRAELKRFGDEQAALRRVAELVARGAALQEVFESVATEASRILGDAATNLVRYDDDVATVVAVHRSSVLPAARRARDGGTPRHRPRDTPGVTDSPGAARRARFAGRRARDTGPRPSQDCRPGDCRVRWR